MNTFAFVFKTLTISLGIFPTIDKDLLLWGKTSSGRDARGRTPRACTGHRWSFPASTVRLRWFPVSEAVTRRNAQPTCEPALTSCTTTWQSRAASKSKQTRLVKSHQSHHIKSRNDFRERLLKCLKNEENKGELKTRKKLNWKILSPFCKYYSKKNKNIEDLK